MYMYIQITYIEHHSAQKKAKERRHMYIHEHTHTSQHKILPHNSLNGLEHEACMYMYIHVYSIYSMYMYMYVHVPGTT